MVMHVYFYFFVEGWIFFYWILRWGSKLSSMFCRCFKFYFKRVPQYCIKRFFFINFAFFDWPFRMCLCPFVGIFTSLIEMLLIFMKKEFLNARKLICFLFPFCLTWWCWWLESEKEQCIRNVWSWEWSV